MDEGSLESFVYLSQIIRLGYNENIRQRLTLVVLFSQFLEGHYSLYTRNLLLDVYTQETGKWTFMFT